MDKLLFLGLANTVLALSEWSRSEAKAFHKGQSVTISAQQIGDTGLLHTKVRLNEFLKQVERKAFRIASIAVGNPDDAMDIVQEAMLSLVKSYASKSEDDWPKLFFRILYNRINDHFRRQSVRQKVMRVRSWFTSDGELEDTIEQAPAHSSAEPHTQLHSDNISASVKDSLKQLSPKQSEAFLMRSWQGLSVADTAKVMGCSEGSVKTHHARAVRRLQELLAQFN